MFTCQCPQSGNVPTFSTSLCTESFGQIQKVAFTRLDDGGGSKNHFESGSSQGTIEKLASWTAKTQALDGTKIAISPFIQAPTDEGGDAITFGGGNETLGGMEIVVGRQPVTFSGVFRGLPQEEIEKAKKLMCDAAAGNLGVYLFDENGNIEGIKKNTEVYPIPIRSLFIGDKIHGGLEAPDSNVISWAYAPNYSDGLAIFTPTDFNPLTDL